MIIKLLSSVILLLIIAACYYFGQNVSMREQLPLFDGLRNTSAIIFGVMGAWLAILHPSSLKKIFSKDSSSISVEDRKTISLLLSPIIISTFIISIVLVVPLFVAATKSIPILNENVRMFRGISFSLLGSLTVLQLWTLILTLIPSDILKRMIQKAEAREKILNGMFSGTRKKRK